MAVQRPIADGSWSSPAGVRQEKGPAGHDGIARSPRWGHRRGCGTSGRRGSGGRPVRHTVAISEDAVVTDEAAARLGRCGLRPQARTTGLFGMTVQRAWRGGAYVLLAVGLATLGSGCGGKASVAVAGAATSTTALPTCHDFVRESLSSRESIVRPLLERWAVSDGHQVSADDWISHGADDAQTVCAGIPIVVLVPGSRHRPLVCGTSAPYQLPAGPRTVLQAARCAYEVAVLRFFN
jgi:hypothetical protein